MKKLTILFLITLSAAAQSQPHTISCQGSKWAGLFWQQCVDQVTSGQPTNICMNPAGCKNSSDWQLITSGSTSAVTSVFTRTGAVVAVSGDYIVGQITGAAPLASPTFTGTPAAPTQSTSDNSTKLATTAFVHSLAGGSSNGYAMHTLTPPTFSGWTATNCTLTSSCFIQTGTAFGSFYGAASSQLKVLHTACPATPWTLYIVFAEAGSWHSSAWFAAGIEVDDGTKFISFGNQLNPGGNNTQSVSWNPISTFQSVLYQETPSFWPGQMFIKFSNDGTNIDFQYSFDGIAWYDAYSQGSTSFLSAVTNCGIFIQGNSGVSAVNSIDVFHWGTTLPIQ